MSPVLIGIAAYILVQLLLGIAPQFDLQDVILGGRAIEEIVLDGPDGIRLVPASSGFS